MPYYRGDYYRGDYYRGDPFLGGLGRAIGRGLKVVGGAALGFITGGPGGAIAGALGGTGKAISSGIREETLAAGGDTSAMTPELRAAHARAVSHGAARARLAARTGMGIMGPGGGIQGASGYVKRRRMNWANSRALGRAERRIKSAVKHMTRYIRWVHPGRPGHAAPKFKRSKK
jgi:hypothetical protein